MQPPIVIIGTGLAGYQLAREFRRLDQDAPLVLLTADEGHYYSKPQLSSALTQEKTATMLATANAESMAQRLNAAIATGARVSEIDTANKMLYFHNERMPYQKLVLACGADPIKAPLQGDAIDDVLAINHLQHYAKFRELLQHKNRIGILGAGLIGCEFANDLSNAGHEVHVIAPANAPLDALIPEQIGQHLKDALTDNGVHFHLGCTVNRVDNLPDNRYTLELSNGNELEVELVISAIGLKPHTQLAEDAGLLVNRGILVNRYLETSTPDIYALGDCAEVEGFVLPFVTPLLQCARALAQTLAGTPTVVDYPAMPIVVKTPAHPIVICPPPRNLSGSWQIDTVDAGVRALFYDDSQQLRGFVLTRDAVKERAALVKQLPDMF